MARPVESKVVISSSARRPSALALERTGLDRVSELAVVACLLPVVAEDVRSHELFDRDLGLAGTVGAHQAHVLPCPERARLEERLVPGRDRDADVCRERLLAGGGHARAQFRRRLARPLLVEVPEQHFAPAGDERPRGRAAVHARADHGSRPRADAERLGREHGRRPGAEEVSRT